MEIGVVRKENEKIMTTDLIRWQMHLMASDLPSGTKVVGFIISLGREERTIEEIAAWTGMGKREVDRAIKQLKAERYLRIIQQEADRPNLYRLLQNWGADIILLDEWRHTREASHLRPAS
jgi:DNA-binding transcriptional regulator GbsR (MarR family)